jgi:hypothetical protein
MVSNRANGKLKRNFLNETIIHATVRRYSHLCDDSIGFDRVVGRAIDFLAPLRTGLSGSPFLVLNGNVVMICGKHGDKRIIGRSP